MKQMVISERIAKKHGINIKGWNLIKCDVCGHTDFVDKTIDVRQVRSDAMKLGWSPAGPGRPMDLCPKCRNL